MEQRKPAPLNALTGLRCFAAVNIVLFHFSDPRSFGFLAPIVNAGYASVSYFILLSGFVLAYNYNARARAGKFDTVRFYKARFTRIYPIYILSLLLSWPRIADEWTLHTHTMFWTGMVLSPLLLQGWIPSLATFLNTPAWTMSAEAFFYLIFPFMAHWKKPTSINRHLLKLGGVWLFGLLPGMIYMIFSPDGIAHPDRWSQGPWLQTLKFTPLPYLASFVFGVLLAQLDDIIPRVGHLRFVLGSFGFAAAFGFLSLGARVPYVLVHDGGLMPLCGCIILGLGGNNPLSAALSIRPLVFVGEASYSLYLLHFNMWKVIHYSHILNRLHLAQFDPWLSYALLILMALAALHFIEKPVQRKLRQWMSATT